MGVGELPNRDMPNRDAVLGAIVLAFAHSRLKDVVGDEALRSVLSGQYRDLVSKGTLHLQVLWDLLENQPGFSEEAARPPFSVLQTWERKLGLVIKPPSPLAKCTSAEFVAQASLCPVPKEKQARVFGRADNKATLAPLTVHGRPRNTQPVSSPSTRKPVLEALLGVIAVAGLAYGTFALYGFLAVPGFEQVATADIPSDMPITKAKQLGTEINLLIEDEEWYRHSPQERQEDLKAALVHLQSKNIDSLIVQDRDGVVRASAQWNGSADDVVIRLN